MKLSQLTVGQVVHVDKGFTCMDAGPKVVKGGIDGLYVDCYGDMESIDGGHAILGEHYLDGQVGPDGHLIGISDKPFP